MCIINRSSKLIGIQPEKKHGKGSKDVFSYFDDRIDMEEDAQREEENDKLIGNDAMTDVQI